MCGRYFNHHNHEQIPSVTWTLRRQQPTNNKSWCGVRERVSASHRTRTERRKQSRPRALVGLPKQRLHRPTEFAKEFSGSVSGSGLWRPGGCHPHHHPLSHLNLESVRRSAHSKRDLCQVTCSRPHRMSGDGLDPTGLYWLIYQY